MKDLIAAYNKIRNVHYKIVDVEYSLTNSIQLINSNGASCTPKHVVLSDLFRKAGFETCFCVYEFQWADLKLDFPKHIRTLLKDFPVDFHTNIEIKMNDEWILIDATWDDALIDAGLPGTKQWNGIASTITAVYANNVHRFNSMEERAAFLKNKRSEDHDAEKERQLIKALNDYFETLRK